MDRKYARFQIMIFPINQPVKPYRVLQNRPIVNNRITELFIDWKVKDMVNNVMNIKYVKRYSINLMQVTIRNQSR